MNGQIKARAAKHAKTPSLWLGLPFVIVAMPRIGSARCSEDASDAL
jgi:hypothetical protein